MMDNRPFRRLLLVLLVALLAGALLAVSGHLAWTDHSHDASPCAVCTWFQFKGWAAVAVVLLVYFFSRRFVLQVPETSFSFCCALPSARAPPSLSSLIKP